MKGCKKASGFTIIEVMIVLAVSGVLLVSAAIMVSGQQSKTGFKTSIYDFQTEMQQIANDVINGNYPNPAANDYTCTQNDGKPPTIISGVTGKGHGTGENINSSTGTLSGCILLGKAVQFDVNSLSSSTIYIYSVVGNLGDSSDNTPVQSLSNAWPELLAPGHDNNHNPDFSPEFIETYQLQYGLHVTWMCYGTSYGTPCDSTTNGISVVVFATNPTTANGGSPLITGAQELEYLPILGTGLDAGPTDSKSIVDKVDGYFDSPGGDGFIIDPAGGVEICVDDQTTNHSGLLTIGGNSEQPNIKLQIYIASNNCSQ
jgi:prepilin-type N-terminal cleavage/methylation domain-containing protein